MTLYLQKCVMILLLLKIILLCYGIYKHAVRYYSYVVLTDATPYVNTNYYTYYTDYYVAIYITYLSV